MEAVRKGLAEARILAVVGVLALLISVSAVNAVSPQVALSNVTSGSETVSVSNMPTFAGFDIAITFDPSYLTFVSFSLSGSIVTSPIITLECVNGVLIVGSSCTAVDGVGVIHLSVVTSSAVSAGSGLLFTINWNIASSPPSCQSPIDFKSVVFANVAGAPISGITTANGEYLGHCSSVPQFPLGIAALVAVVLPLLVVLRNRTFTSRRFLP